MSVNQHLRWLRGTVAERAAYSTDSLVAPAWWFDEDDAEQPLYWNGSAWVEVGKASSISGTLGRVAQFVTASTIGDANIAGPDANLLTFAATVPATLTVPETGTAGLLGRTQTWTAVNTFHEDVLIEKTTLVTLMVGRSSANAFGPVLGGRKSRGTLTVPTAVLSGDILFRFQANGYMATGWSPAAFSGIMRAVATENWNDAATGKKIDFLSIPNGSIVPLIRMTIDQDGSVLIEKKLIVGGVPTAAQLTVKQPSLTGAQPVLFLDQRDVSEESLIVSYGGADVDMIIYKLDVTGGPQHGWDESEDRFTFDHGLAVGDGTNQVVISGTGVVTLEGTARTTNGLWVSASGLKAPGTKPATYIGHGIDGAWSFSDEAVAANQQTISGTMRIAERMDRSAAPTFCIGWSADGVNPGVCEWQLEYLWTGPNEDTTAAAQETLTQTGTASATSNGLVATTITGIDIPSAADICLHFRIKRLSAGGNDTIADSTEILGVVLDFTSNKLGEST